mgnify:CR=1 FL=1
MSRTFRRDESGRKAQDSRRAKKREKNDFHWSAFEKERDNKDSKSKSNRNYNDNFELDN